MTNTFTTKNGDVFEMSCDLMDVTSMRRPDETWRYTDVRGHLHQWFEDGQPMERYRPDRTHDTPTLVWVKDGEEYWEGDDEPHPVGHNECRECGEHIEPRYTADTTTQYVAARAARRLRSRGERRDADRVCEVGSMAVEKNDGGPAFPRITEGVISHTGIGSNRIIRFDQAAGMSLRDWFAGQVLANSALAPYVDDGGWNEHTVAKLAYVIADAMLKEREK